MKTNEETRAFVEMFENTKPGKYTYFIGSADSIHAALEECGNPVHTVQNPGEDGLNMVCRVLKPPRKGGEKKQMLVRAMDKYTHRDIAYALPIAYVRSLVSTYNKETDRPFIVLQQGDLVIVRRKLEDRDYIRQEEFDVIKQKHRNLELLLADKIRTSAELAEIEAAAGGYDEITDVEFEDEGPEADIEDPGLDPEDEPII